LTLSTARRPALAVLAVAPVDLPRATELAGLLALPLAPVGTLAESTPDFDALLLVAGADLALQQTRRLAGGGRRGSGPLPGAVRVDFGVESMRHRRRAGHVEMLGRAVGVSARCRPRVLDATAGLGRDSFVLADMGCDVSLCEREPVVAALLRQGIDAARGSSDEWLQQAARRMHLMPGDATLLFTRDDLPADVIYLDPMFPPRGKRAAVKKEMALFQALLDSSSRPGEAEALLAWARDRDVARVVVKRPPRAAHLGGDKPSHSLAGKAVRFDVYVRRRLD
jgi:16S rRNA (guanine1516-N2)-methyltransferase